MISSKVSFIMLVAGAMLVAGCQKKPPPPPTLNQSMKGVMEPQADTIWDITSRAYNDVGDGYDPRKISVADWDVIRDAAQQMKDRAQALADADQIVVVGPGEKMLGQQAVGEKGKIGKTWDAAGPQQVDQRIKAKPELFKKRARELADAAGQIAQAAASKDVPFLYKTTSNLDEVCDACHEPFWGTDQPPPAK